MGYIYKWKGYVSFQNQKSKLVLPAPLSIYQVVRWWRSITGKILLQFLVYDRSVSCLFSWHCVLYFLVFWDLYWNVVFKTGFEENYEWIGQLGSIIGAFFVVIFLNLIILDYIYCMWKKKPLFTLWSNFNLKS